MYQVLYRKYRPQVFSDVVGQPHITQTLQQELETGKLSHAYLFTGSRGTGKTTCAKILAKAVNCLHPVGGNPCNECDVCRGIDSGAILDVTEIDAASNNGVDNIRDIRDESNFAPVNCRYRVYIIDEVHMLSIGAFNALLKTLEEPPAHVMFILATTEVHKLPVTILSRCQRFDFHRVSPEAMLERMQTIAEEEGFSLDEDAALLIARLADGGMRDALSVLDQCLGRDRHVTQQLVTDVAGITGKDHLFTLCDLLSKHETAKAIELLGALHGQSVDMERLCGDLVMHFRNLMIAKTVRGAENVLVCTPQELSQYRAQSAAFTLETILYIIDLLQEAAATMKKGVDRRIEMETALLRAADPALNTDSKALLGRIASLEHALRTGRSAAEEPPAEDEPPVQPAEPEFEPEMEPVAVPEPEPEPVPEPVMPEPEPSAEPAPAPVKAPKWETPQRALQPEPAPEPVVPEPAAPNAEAQAGEDNGFYLWPQVMTELAAINKPMWGILQDSTAFERGDFILIKSENPTVPAFIKTGTNAKDVKEAIQRATGRRYRLGIYSRPVREEPPQPKEDPLQSLLSKAKQFGVWNEEE